MNKYYTNKRYIRLKDNLNQEVSVENEINNTIDGLYDYRGWTRVKK